MYTRAPRLLAREPGAVTGTQPFCYRVDKTPHSRRV